jgi:hypothetical protein
VDSLDFLHPAPTTLDFVTTGNNKLTYKNKEERHKQRCHSFGGKDEEYLFIF